MSKIKPGKESKSRGKSRNLKEVKGMYMSYSYDQIPESVGDDIRGQLREFDSRTRATNIRRDKSDRGFATYKFDVVLPKNVPDKKIDDLIDTFGAP